MNEDLQERNYILQQKVDKFEEAEKIHAKKQAELSKMIIESQANQKEIEELYQQKQESQEEYEKLNVEITVLVTEKVTIKKENDRVTNEKNNLLKELKV